MAQNINVDVTPNLFQPTLYYHQGDIGRAFTITISTKDGYTIPSGATVKIEATKPSGLGFSVSGTLSGNVVSFVSTEGMTDEYGRFPAQLKITSGNDILYTANFLMVGAINTHPASVTDGTAEQVISEITLLVERAETAASTAATDAANAAQARVDEMMNYLPTEVSNLKSEINDNTSDISALQASVTNLGTHKVAQPLDNNNQPTNGTSGQSLRTKGDGTTEWTDVGLPTDAQTAQAVSDWLDDHPEATTTVQDGSLTEAKFSNALKLKAIKDYVTPEMFGAKGDGIVDDTDAIRAAIAASDSIVFVNEYKVSDTIYLSGGKTLDILGTVHYTGTDKLFYMSNQFNNIDGHSIGTITGDGGSGTLIWITTTDEGGTERYSYFNKVINITIRESARGIMLYNPERGSASYFNTINKCMISGCPVGIELKGFANGNRLNNIVFYNCGVANDITKASVVFTEENDKYPEENNLSQIFVTNSTDTVCFLANGRCIYNIFNEIIVEPGGTASWSFYTLDYTKIKSNQFQIIDLTYNGGNFVKLDKSNTVIQNGEMRIGELSFANKITPLSRTKCYTSNEAFAENAWIPLLSPDLGNKKTMRVSLILYCTSANSFSNQYHDPLNTNVYNNNGYGVTNSDKFKYEDGMLYFKAPPIYNGGLQFFFSIELTLGSRDLFRDGDIAYTMDSTWTEMQLVR